MQDDDLASRFLEQFGMSGDAMTDPASHVVVVDSGFRGTIGRQLNARLQAIHGVDVLARDGMDIKLVSAHKQAIGSRALTFDMPVRLSRTEQVIPSPQRAFTDYDNAFELAVSMQLMPRYHGKYTGLSGHGSDDVMAEPIHDYRNRQLFEFDIDRLPPYSINHSVVNPVAAAITQFRVVQAAMQRS